MQHLNFETLQVKGWLNMLPEISHSLVNVNFHVIIYVLTYSMVKVQVEW